MLSLEECNGLEIIGGNTNNLVISEDHDGDPAKPYPVLLLTPNMNNVTNHYHIELQPQHAKKLHDWLGKFLQR